MERLLQQSLGGFFFFFPKVNLRFGFGLRSERPTQREKNWLGAAPSRPQTLEKLSQWERGHQIHLLHLLWRGDQHQTFTRFTSVLLELLCEYFVLAFVSLDTGAVAIFFSPHQVASHGGFFFFPWHFGLFCSVVGGSALCLVYAFFLWTMSYFRVVAYCWFWLWTVGIHGEALAP